MLEILKERLSRVRVVLFFAALNLLSTAVNGQEQNFRSVTNVSDLEILVNDPWTNTLCIMPPGKCSYNTDVGVLICPNGFVSGFLPALSPATNFGVELFPVKVVETNTTPRQRFYLNMAGVAAHTTTVDMAGYPDDYIVATYGTIPSYLSGSDITQWLDERDPLRQQVLFTLIAQSNANAYYVAMTNALTVTVDETNTVSLLDVHSNDIAFVKTGTRNDGLFEYYLHAPTNVPQLELFLTTNLLNSPGGWDYPIHLSHSSDPLHGVITGNGTNSPMFLTAGNPAIDSDGDGLPDCLEKWVLGTNPNLWDSDGDGLSDGEEVYRYGTNPNLKDTDGDGLSDGQEIALGMNPLSATDGAALLAEAKANIILHWNMVYSTPLTFSNPPGSAADLQDVDVALATLSTNFFKAEAR